MSDPENVSFYASHGEWLGRFVAVFDDVRVRLVLSSTRSPRVIRRSHVYAI